MFVCFFVCLFVCLFNITSLLRRVWGLAFSAAGQADTFAFSLQGALEALGLEEERKGRREEERIKEETREVTREVTKELIKEETRDVNNEEEDIRTKDGEGGWSPRRER